MPRRWVIGLLVFCALLNTAGFLFDLFEPVPLYDEIAHLFTPLVLVAIAAELIYRGGGDDEFFGTPRRAVTTGVVIGLVGATGWEGIELLLRLLGFEIDQALPDTIFDVILGGIGGAVGAYLADYFLDHYTGRPRRSSPPRRRVR